MNILLKVALNLLAKLVGKDLQSLTKELIFNNDMLVVLLLIESALGK
jgi:hypothetical protein